MLLGFPDQEFLQNLQECCAPEGIAAASVAARGSEGVIVMTPESVLKIYALAEKRRDLNAYRREHDALQTLGGHVHAHFTIPMLKSAAVFQKSFSLLGMCFAAMTEQTRVRGDPPGLATPAEQRKLGAALGEFHGFLKAKTGEGMASLGNLVERRLKMLTEKIDSKPMLKPGIRKQLMQDITTRLAARPTQPVHGDFRAGNFLWDGDSDKYAILDLTTIGDSVPEQDLAHLVHLPREALTQVAQGYKDVTGTKPSIPLAQRLHLLDLAVAMNCAQSCGNERGAESLRKRFENIWATAYPGGTATPTHSPKKAPGAAPG